MKISQNYHENQSIHLKSVVLEGKEIYLIDIPESKMKQLH